MQLDAKELIELAIAAVAIILVLFVLRRASIASRNKAKSARERLDLEEEAPAKRQRRRPRPGEEALPPPAKPARKPVEDKPEVHGDAEEAAAYKAGLTKTRGGFVAKLGKLFSKKKIDAATSAPKPTP